MGRTLAGRGALTVETNDGDGTIYIMQVDSRGNTESVNMGPHDVPQVVKWLQDAAAEMTGELAPADLAKPETSLVGHGFHSFVACDVCGKRRVDRQGEIIEQVGPTTYLVQHFSWLDGSPTTRKVVTLEEMQDWDLYADADEMNDYYAARLSRQHEQCLGLSSSGVLPLPVQKARPTTG